MKGQIKKISKRIAQVVLGAFLIYLCYTIIVSVLVILATFISISAFMPYGRQII